MRKLFAAAAAGLTVALATADVRVVARQQTPADPIFTTEQAAAGKMAYGRTCARCHMPDLGGTADAPPLSGSRFLDTWRRRTTKELFEFVSGAMPPGGPAVNGEIKADTYTAILAYVLQSNGAVAGSTPLEPSVVLPLDRIVRAASLK